MVTPGGIGPLNISLLVKVTGSVTYVDTSATRKFFYIDDGSGLADGTSYGGAAMRGVRVWFYNLSTGNTITPPFVGERVVVTGICTPYSAAGKTMAQIRLRQQSDIEPVEQ